MANKLRAKLMASIEQASIDFLDVSQARQYLAKLTGLPIATFVPKAHRISDSAMFVYYNDSHTATIMGALSKNFGKPRNVGGDLSPELAWNIGAGVEARLSGFGADTFEVGFRRK